MANNFVLVNEDRILRPVTIDDAEFIMKLRNQKHAQGTIHQTDNDVEKQREWIMAYLQRENEYYWIICDKNNNPIGTVSLYHYDENANEIEQGRWVMLQDTDINFISNTVQIQDFAFYYLKVNRLVCDVVSTNKKVLKYHKFLGKTVTKRETIYGVCDDAVEVIWMEQKLDDWPQKREHLLKFCGDTSKWFVYKDGKQIKIY
jgi:RimJ/RimL family protein N-acetyltransferase